MKNILLFNKYKQKYLTKGGRGHYVDYNYDDSNHCQGTDSR